MSAQSPRIVIIGAGPTGLGAAHRLSEIGYRNWTLIEAAPSPGGLACSIVDREGFTWDMGGHVLFSHYDYFDRLMDGLLPDGWIEHRRATWVWMRNRFIPYPLQNNAWKLPFSEFMSILMGLWRSRAKTSEPPVNFREWLLGNFGRGLYDSFLGPYNQKVWAYDPALLNTEWMAERVATVDLGRLVNNALLRKEDSGWGPNANFRYPLCGGTGAIWKALFDRLPGDHVRLGARVSSIQSAAKTILLEDGSTIEYDQLVSTMPMDHLLRLLTDRRDLAHYADGFRYSSTHAVGVGLEGKLPDRLAGKFWMYFPEPDVPFYRINVFSNFSPHNVPDIRRHWSLLAEISESPEKPVSRAAIEKDTVEGLRRSGLLPPSSKIVSLWSRRLEHGYPTPFVGRDDLLARVEPALRAMGIRSRGRFGAWKYEVSNQDHSMMQGVEAVDGILFGKEETTFEKPTRVNAGVKLRQEATTAGSETWAGKSAEVSGRT